MEVATDDTTEECVMTPVVGLCLSSMYPLPALENAEYSHMLGR